MKMAADMLVRGMRDSHAEGIARLQAVVSAMTIRNENLQNELPALPRDCHLYSSDDADEDES